MVTPIYLDFQATTPTDPRVVDAMMPYFSERFGNPHSRQHAVGRQADDAVAEARAAIARLIAADPRDIIFTSGATESNNLAIRGAARFAADSGAARRHIVTCVTEHKCVLESARVLESDGFRVTRLPVNKNGLIDLDRLAAVLDDETLLVSIMAVNNEIGVVQPLAEIGQLCRARGALFHTDAAQAAGRIPLDVNGLGIDLMSLSAHKVYGPKGVGALYVRRRPRVRLQPLFAGGGQERGLRSGTLPTPLCVGFGEACRIAGAEQAAEAKRLARLRDRLLDAILDALPDTHVNGDRRQRIAGNLNLAFPGIEAEELMASLPDLALSTGSACTSAAVEPSHVLAALGLGGDLAFGSLRIGLGRTTTDDDVDHAAGRLIGGVKRLRGGRDRRPAVAPAGGGADDLKLHPRAEHL